MRLLSRDLDGKYRIYDDHREERPLTKITERIQQILDKGEENNDGLSDNLPQRERKT